VLIRFPALRAAAARADSGTFSFLIEGVLAKPLAWTVSEEAEGAVGLGGVFGARPLVLAAGWRRGGIV